MCDGIPQSQPYPIHPQPQYPKPMEYMQRSNAWLSGLVGCKPYPSLYVSQDMGAANAPYQSNGYAPIFPSIPPVLPTRNQYSPVSDGQPSPSMLSQLYSEVPAITGADSQSRRPSCQVPPNAGMDIQLQRSSCEVPVSSHPSAFKQVTNTEYIPTSQPVRAAGTGYTVLPPPYVMKPYVPDVSTGHLPFPPPAPEPADLSASEFFIGLPSPLPFSNYSADSIPPTRSSEISSSPMTVGIISMPNSTQSIHQEPYNSSLQKGQWVQPAQSQLISQAESAPFPNGQTNYTSQSTTIEEPRSSSSEFTTGGQSVSTSQNTTGCSFIPIATGSEPGPGNGSRRAIQFPSETHSPVAAAQNPPVWGTSASSMDLHTGTTLQPLAGVSGYHASPVELIRQGVSWYNMQSMGQGTIDKGTHVGQGTVDKGTHVYSSPLTAISSFMDTSG